MLRRAAARAVYAPRVIRPAARFNTFQSSIPSVSRSFHQSRTRLAEAEKKEAESSEQASSPAQDAVSESSGTTSEPIGQSEQQPTSTISSPAQDAVSESSGTTSEPIGQSEQHPEPIPTSTSESSAAHDAVSESSGTTSEPVGQSEHQPQSVGEQASELAEKAKDVASKVTEAAQDTIPSPAQAVSNTLSRNPYNRFNADKNSRFSPNGPKITGKILYVGNLFFEVTAPQLEAEFSKYGEITNSRVVTDNRGLSKGFGYVEFRTSAQAEDAIQGMNQTVFQGRRLAVQHHQRRDSQRTQTPAQPSNTLFIGNMSYQMSDRDLNGMYTAQTYCSLHKAQLTFQQTFSGKFVTSLT